MNVYFIILTYKPALSALIKNISVLENNTLIIVDNSEDEEIEKELKKKVTKKTQKLIITPKNIGYSGGMNIGLKEAFKNGAEWVVLLNDDVLLTKESIGDLETILKNQSPAILGPFRGSLDKNKWTTILHTPSPHPSPERGGRIPDYISGACMVIHKNVDARVQGFYPDYFMYYEDVDYCIQARKAGFPLVPITLSGIHHQEGKSIIRGSDLHEYYLARNHLLFVERQAPTWVKLREFLLLPKLMWEYHFYGNRAAFKGVLDFIFLRYGKTKRTLRNDE